jgi:hypothetical protein
VTVDDKRATMDEDEVQDDDRLFDDLKKYVRAVRIDLEAGWTAMAKFLGGTGDERELELYELEKSWRQRRAGRQ